MRGPVHRWNRVIIAAGCVAGFTLVEGCTRVQEQFPDRRFARPYIPPSGRDTVMAPTVGAAPFTNRALDTLPADVQVAFARQHPKADIARVDQVPSGTGPMLYRITYLQDGLSESVTYHSNGRTHDVNSEGTVILPDNSGRLPPKRVTGETAQRDFE